MDQQATATAKVIERPFGPFERMLAMRYLGAKREHGGLAFISVVSVIGIMLGVLALVVVMSVMNGFRLELISKIIGFEPHVFVTTQGLPREQVDALMEELRMRPGVESVEPMTDGTALASAHDQSQGIQVRGVLPEDLRKNKLITRSISDGRRARDTISNNPNGQWPDHPIGDGSLDHFGDGGEQSDDIVLGDTFARQLNVGVGDTIQLAQANGAHTIAGVVPRTSYFKVAAIYHVGNERYDAFIAFLPLARAQNFFGQDAGPPVVGIRLADPDNADAFKAALLKDKPYFYTTWKERNGTYITALVVERNVMRLILFIVVMITALNIITGVLMLVKNKARDIAILRTIGATRAGVVRIFMMTGTVLGMAGVGTGVLLGILIVIFIAPIQHFLEGLLHMQLFPSDIYMLDSLPAQLEWAEVGTVAGAAFLVTLMMSIIPSMWAARLNPVEALRFE